MLQTAWWIGAAAFFVPFLVYLATLAPTVTLEDSGELITAAAYLGVAHPPGYPLWCLLAHGFTWLPLGNVAERVHLLSAVCAAGTSWFCYLLASRIVGHRLAALLGALALAGSLDFWSQAVIAEVYTLNSLLTVAAIYCVLRWKQTHHGK